MDSVSAVGRHHVFGLRMGNHMQGGKYLRQR